MEFQFVLKKEKAEENKHDGTLQSANGTFSVMDVSGADVEVKVHMDVPVETLFTQQTVCDDPTECARLVLQLLVPYSFDLSPNDTLYHELQLFLPRACAAITAKLRLDSDINMSIVGDICREAGIGTTKR
jgi:hypothetical protein